jgi:hypothetical protein
MSINKHQYLSVALIVFIFLIIAKQNSFFKNAYFVFKFSYKERLLNQYNFCGYESLGFLDYIKQKYNLSQKIPIINFGNSPNPSWFYADLKDSKDSDKAIFLSYGRNQERFSQLYNLYNFNKYKIIEKFESCYYVVRR